MVLGEPLKRIQKYAKYGWSWAQAKKRQLIICFHSQTQTKESLFIFSLLNIF